VAVVVEPVSLGQGDTARHHVVIAGTGRAGTSFLVRFLGECGLDTGPSNSLFDQRARAGLEHNLLDDEAPYIVKDPWLFAYCEQIDPGAIAIDALLVPVRELMAAATSRMLQERAAMAEGPWANLPSSDVNGIVPGGAVYSLDPVDEARILAVGFHRLIHWATARQLPLFLLEFPRAVKDREYLIESLWPWLSGHCDRQRALAAFAAVADPQLVRVEGIHRSCVGRLAPDAAQLDREAMAILLEEQHTLLSGIEDQLAEAREASMESERRLEETRSLLAQMKDTVAQRDAALIEMQARFDAVSAEAGALRHTLSWRATRPLRWLRTLGTKAASDR
jgi:hypothetical protein